MKENVRFLLKTARRVARREGLHRAGHLLRDVWREADSSNEDELRADVAHRLAAVYRDHGDKAQAEEFARLAIKFETRVGRDEVLGNHLMFLADLLATSGRYEQALACAEYGLACYLHAYGEGHIETEYVGTFVDAIRRVARAMTPMSPSYPDPLGLM